MTISPPTSLPTMGTQWEWRAQKVQSWHTDRLAVVYVRQSSPQQVLHHQESTRLQYGLTIRAQDLGWASSRVLLIDDDQATSGSSAEGRVPSGRQKTEPPDIGSHPRTSAN